MSFIAIDRVSIQPNRRPLNDQKVAELMQSIKANGLLNPITIDQNFNLIAGLHRLTACKLLGLEQIEYRIITCEDVDHARLAEIDENLIRNELEALERAELWLERDQILERIGLRAQSGENQYTKKGGEIDSPPGKTTVQLAQEAGYNKRTYQLGKQIAKNIDPEVKEVIKKTPVAKNNSTLLKIARAGSKEREQAEQAEQKLQEAKRQQKQEEMEIQAKLAAEARTKLKEQQLIALQSSTAQKQAKQCIKSTKPLEKSMTATPTLPGAELGDEWILDRHLVYCGDTAEDQFIDLLPSNAALAIATLSSEWNHDYLINEAHIVAVLAHEGHIQDFCARHRMPFRFEWVLGELYVGIYSQDPILKPEKPVGIEGVEGIVAYLISLYTKHDNFVLAPFLGHAEVLIACERMGRICFAGDKAIENVGRAIARWQKWTGQEAKREKHCYS
ncbi:ParB N-terminal domain-containing protein [Halotia wernerae UHCC 0503]|nr:ParB N-terminal domain-containing protein [Halotia wernerae UHCC 0503]